MLVVLFLTSIAATVGEYEAMQKKQTISARFTWMAAASSAPKPEVSGASWVTMHLPVFFTELNTVS